MNAPLPQLLVRAAQDLRDQRPAAAQSACLDILAHDPGHAPASELLGLAICGLGDHEQGRRFICRAIALAPGRPQPYTSLAGMLQSAPPHRAATDFLIHAVALDPTSSDGHHNLGAARLRENAPDKAAADLGRAVALAPERSGSWTLLGAANHRLFRYDAAVGALWRAVALNPRSAQAAFHLANTLRDVGRVDAAISHLERVLALRPDFAAAEFSLALSYLMAGRFEQGWRAYESRWRGAGDAVRGRVKRHAARAPEWCGAPVAPESRLLVVKEQGWGDNLMLARYVPRLRERFGEVGYYCPVPLERLFRHSFGADCTVTAERGILSDARFTHAIPLMSLPLATAMPVLADRAPYLTAAPDEVEAWGRRFLARQLSDGARPNIGSLRVGLAWTGGRVLPQRSMPLAAAAPLLADQRIAWVSLSKLAALPDQLDLARKAGLIDWVEGCRDFADTAALIANLDLVISIDTAVAHLAGALGKPVWLINRFESDWRWLRGRSDNPWYPTMRLFTQPAPGDWAGAISAIRAELAGFVAGHPGIVGAS